MPVLPTVRDFLNLLEAHELTHLDSDRDLPGWSDAAANAFVERTAPALRACTEAARLAVEGSPGALVLCAEARDWCSTSLLRRCLLYGDWVILPVSFPEPGPAGGYLGIKPQLAKAASDLQQILPFIETGLVLPVAAVEMQGQLDPRSIDGLLSSGPIEEVRLRHLSVARAHQPVVDPRTQIQGTFSYSLAEFDGCQRVRFECHDPVWVPISPSDFLKQSFEACSLRDLPQQDVLHGMARDVVGTRLEQLAVDWFMARHKFGGALVTKSDVAWRLLHGIAAYAGHQAEIPVESALPGIDVPFLDNVPPHVICEERDRDRDQLEAMRLALHVFAQEVDQAVLSGAGPGHLRFLQSTHLEQPVREIESRLREAERKGLLNLICSGAVAVSVLCVAAWTGQPAAGVAVVPALGWLKDTLNDMAASRASASRCPLYALWRIKRRARA